MLKVSAASRGNARGGGGEKSGVAAAAKEARTNHEHDRQSNEDPAVSSQQLKLAGSRAKTTREPDLSRKIGRTSKLQDAAQAAAECQLVIKLNLEKYNEITIEDVGEYLRLAGEISTIPADSSRKSKITLMSQPTNEREMEDTAMGQLANGPVNLELLEMLLTGMCQPAFADEEVQIVYSNLQQCVDGTIMAETFLEAVTSGVIRQMFMQLRYMSNAKNVMIRRLVLVDRSILDEVVGRSVKRDDALGTLLFTLLYLSIMVAFVVVNLRCYGRFHVEDAMEHYVEGFGASLSGPFLQKHIVDVNSYWAWLNTSAAQAVYGTHARRDGYEQFMLANQHSLIGDTRLRLTLSDESTQETWILSSGRGKAFLNTNPGDYLSAAVRVITELHDVEQWNAPNTRSMEILFCTFNMPFQYLALTVITTNFLRSGLVRSTVSTRSFPISESIEPQVWAANLMYVLAMLWLVGREGFDLFSAARLGPKEFLDYWNAWNAIDWTTILCAILNAVLWFMLQVSLRAEPLPQLLEDPQLMTRDEVYLERMVVAMQEVHDKLRGMQWMLFVTMLFVLAKFFKGYRANPRLQVVSETIKRSFLDIAHFFLVFFSIFFCFAFVGHIFFGADVYEFSSVWNAFYTSFSTLMGEFEWYVTLSMTYEDTFPSGIPRAAMTLWFITFIVCVLLVLLNMLMAIILQEYAFIMEGMQDRIDADTLFTQIFDVIRRLWVQRGWFGLTKVLLALENDYAPAHPERYVTEESLLAAFPEMKSNEATWIMNIVLETVCHRSMKEVTPQEMMAQQTERHVKSLVVSLSTLQRQTNRRLDRIEAALRKVQRSVGADAGSRPSLYGTGNRGSGMECLPSSTGGNQDLRQRLSDSNAVVEHTAEQEQGGVIKDGIHDTLTV